ncbi:MAG: MFS transporter [Ilumatobacteraceae bacterium]
MSSVTPPRERRYAPGTVRAALAYRDFRIVFVGMVLSFVGTWMQNFTLPAYVDDRTESAALVGLLVFMQLGPMLLLSVVGGVLADRFNRMRFLISMQVVQMAATIGLAVLVAVHSPLWTLYAAVLLTGVANALNAPAFQASIPLLVGRADLAGAISLNSAAINGSRVLGPALAAVLAAIGFSVAQVFLVNAATFLFLIAALLVVRIPDVRGDHPERGWRRLLTGINISRRREVVSRTLLAMCMFSLFSLPFVGLFPSVARLNFGISSSGSTYKWLYVTWGLGAFAGALAVGTVLARFDRRHLVSIGFGAFAVCLGAFAVVRSAGPAFPVAIALGFTYFLTATALSTIFQENLANTERAAVMPLWFMAFGGTVPIGNLAFGPVIDAIGARWVLLFGAAFAAFLAGWADLHRLSADAFLPEELGGEPFQPANAARLH